MGPADLAQSPQERSGGAGEGSGPLGREAAALGLLAGSLAAPPLCGACEEGDRLTYDGPRDVYLCRCGAATTGQVASQTGLRRSLRRSLEAR